MVDNPVRVTVAPPELQDTIVKESALVLSSAQSVLPLFDPTSQQSQVYFLGSNNVANAYQRVQEDGGLKWVLEDSNFRMFGRG